MRASRARRGSAIAETGPALFMFLILIFFPVLDVTAYGLQYACCWYHNHLMLEELAGRTQAEGASGQVHSEIVNRFLGTGLAKFFRIDTTNPANVTDAVTYDNASTPPIVSCKTTLQGAPFIEIPFLGLTKTKFSMSGEAVREVTR